MNKNNIWMTAKYTITLQYDDRGELFDVNIYDGVHSISTDSIERVSEIIKELEERCK